MAASRAFLSYSTRRTSLAMSNEQPGILALPPEVWSMILDWLLRPVRISLSLRGVVRESSKAIPAILLVNQLLKDAALAWYFRHEVVVSINASKATRCWVSNDMSFPDQLRQRMRRVRIWLPSDEEDAIDVVVGGLARVFAESPALDIVTVYTAPDYGSLPDVVPSHGLKRAIAPLLEMSSLEDKVRWDPTNFDCDITMGRNMLWAAVQEGNTLAIDAILSRSFHTLNIMCQGYTPLQIAIRRGDLRITERLLQTGALLLNRATFGAVLEPPLHMAAAYGRCSIVRILLRAGADAHLLDYQGRTALQTAILHCEDEAANILRQWRIV